MTLPKWVNLRTAGWVLAGLVGLIVLVIALLHSPPVRQYALNKVAELLSRRGVSFHVESLDYNLLDLNVTLTGLVIKSSTAQDLPPVLQADRVHVDMSLSQLLKGTYYIEDAEISNPRVNVVVDAQGKDNVPRGPESKDKTKTDYLIDDLRISGGQIRYEDRRQPLLAELPLNRIHMDGDPATGNHLIDITGAQGGKLTFKANTLPLRELVSQVLLEENALDVRKFELGMGDSTLAFSGRLNNFDDPRFDVKADTTLQLGSLVEIAGLQQKLTGTVQMAIAAKGPASQLEINARVNGKEISVEQFQHLSIQSEAQYKAADSRVRIESLNIHAPAGIIQGEASIALNARAGTSTANVATRNLNLAELSRTLELPVRIASRANARIAARWPAMEFEKAAADADVRLIPSRSAPAKDVIPVAAHLNAKTEGQRINVGIRELRALDAQASGNVTLLNRERLNGNLELQAPDLAASVRSAESLLGKAPGTLLGTPLSGAATVNAHLSGTTKAPVVDAQMQAPSLSAGTLQGIQVAASVRYGQDRLTIQQANVNWRDQGLSASGVVGMKGTNPPVQLEARSQNISIESVLAGLNRTDIPASGQVALEASVSGTTKQPAADVRIDGTNLTAYQETFGNLEARVNLRDQLLTIQEIKLDKPQPGGNGTLQASGTYQLDTKQYSFQAKSDNLKLTSLTLPDGRAVRGELALQGSGQGTVQDPAGSLALQASHLQVAAQQFGDLKANASVANGKAELEASAPKFNLSLRADAGTAKPYPSNFELTVDKFDLSSLPVEIKQPVAGTVSATVRGTGEIENYKDGKATAEVRDLNLTFKGEPIRTEGPVRAHYENRQLTIDQAVVVAGQSRIDVKGTLPLENTAPAGSIQLDAKLDLPTLTRYIPLDQPLSARGTASINGTITGNLQRIDPNVAIAVDNVFVDMESLRVPVRNLNLKAEIRDGALELSSLTVDYGPASLAASGTVPFALLPANLPVELPRRQGPAQITAELKELLLGTVQGVPENVGGVVSAKLEASAPRPELEAVTATLSFPELKLNLGSFDLAQTGTSRIVMANGVARVEQFTLTGPETNLQIAGTAGLTGNRPLDVKVSGNLNAAIADQFTRAARLGGKVELQLALNGTAAQPQAAGFVQLADASVSVQNPRIGIDGLNARLDLSGTRATLTSLQGSLNGGRLSGGGAIEYTNGELRNTNLRLKADEVFFDYPIGLKTVSNVTLQLQNAGENLNVGGQVEIIEGGYTDDLYFDRGVLAAITSPSGLETAKDRNPLLERVRLNLPIRTTNPIVIDNNLATAEITANLRVLGTPYETGMSGTLTIEEGGELRLQERDYIVERAIITFTNERKIEPGLDIAATTTAGGYDIRLQITGEPGKTETTLTSDPSLPETDILAILLTGRPLNEIRGQEFEVASTQVLSYLTGRVGSQLSSSLRRATGLSTVRIEPNLIAAETDPGARLTVGQDITRNLELIYSMDLVNSADQIYVAEYDISRRFSTRGVRQSDGSFRGDFRHEIRFGGTPEPRRGAKRAQRIINSVDILGESYFSELKIEDKLKAKPGKKYDFFKARNGVDRVKKMYEKEDLLEATVRLKREEKDSAVDLDLEVNAGPKVELVFEGVAVPNGTRKDVRQVWVGGVFDRQRGDDSVEALKAWLVKEDYLRPQITYTISKPAEDRKRVVFDIQPGPKFHDVKWVFEGSQGIEGGTLEKLVKKQKLSTDVYVAPDKVTELVQTFYQDQGYLDAKVQTPRYELNSSTSTGQVVFPVVEGPHYKIGEVTFEGNKVFDNARLSQAVALPAGHDYRPSVRLNALERLRDVYWNNGYNDVDTTAEVQRGENGVANLRFRVVENQQSVVRDIVITGNQNTSDNLILTQLELKPGEVLDLQKLSRSRRNLYNTGAYSLVEINREEIAANTPTDQTRSRTVDGQEKAMRLAVNVREIQPFELRYGGFFDTERGPGVIADLANRNSLGSARVLGLRTRYDSQLKEARLYFSQPQLRRFPLRTIASPFLRRESNPETAKASAFNVDRLGLSIQQEALFHRAWILNYGYRIEKSRTYDVGPEQLFNVPLRLGTLTSTLSRETRDEILDASRGSFISQAFQWSPELLGSQVRFIKYYGQFFKYVPLQKPRVELFTNEILRPRLVYAGAVRFGMSKGLGGQDIPLLERFFSGGGTTVRGFQQNSLGGELGGNAVLVINNELRFPLISIFDGVGFVDLGNVYRNASDFSFTDIRKAAGMGLRVRTPWFLLRLDYGVNLSPRENESRSRLFFSIGQAF